MQISNWTAPLVLMHRLPLAQPFLPLFPPSYPLPNRICRILESHFLRRQECQNTRPAACWDMHPALPQTYRKKPWMWGSCSHLISTWCVATTFCVKCHECTARIADSDWLTTEIRLSATPPCPSLTRCADDLKRSFNLFMENRSLHVWQTHKLLKGFGGRVYSLKICVLCTAFNHNITH